MILKRNWCLTLRNQEVSKNPVKLHRSLEHNTLIRIDLEHFWPARMPLHGYLALATLSPLETDPQNFGALGLR